MQIPVLRLDDKNYVTGQTRHSFFATFVIEL